ncbi:MAG: hypothetical protein ACRC1H_12195 [Caldilineaceae bacterium]
MATPTKPPASKSSATKSSGAKPSGTKPAPAPAPRRRTLPITLLAVISVIAGISAVFDTFRYLGWMPTSVTTVMGELSFYNFSWFGAILSGLVALIWFATAGQLWRLDPRGWMFVAVIATINLVFLLLAWLGQSSWSSVALGVIISGVALILAMLPSTKAAFGIPPQPARR